MKKIILSAFVMVAASFLLMGCIKNPPTCHGADNQAAAYRSDLNGYNRDYQHYRGNGMGGAYSSTK